jgi:phenylacetate-coenzyme A ligase PaaK-like adenylate-forming protein
MHIFDWKSFDNKAFTQHALELFQKQAVEVEIYRQFIENLGINPKTITKLDEIPFLPVEFFKSSEVYCGQQPPEIVFTSSSTTNTGQSRHMVASIDWYRDAFIQSFLHFFGNPEEFCFLFLLPSYMEREGSSLIFMAEELVKMSNYGQSGFYLNNFNDLHAQLIENEDHKIPTILFGVSFALLDFAENCKINLQSTKVMETGGMKGRRAELPREALHEILTKSFGVASIYSEYGMTELLSQAYSTGNGLFSAPPWMKIMLYNPYNPLSISTNNTGGINIIDLSNRDSCAFLQTSDIGRIHSNEQFEILGRFDYSDVRGCNLLVY